MDLKTVAIINVVLLTLQLSYTAPAPVPGPQQMNDIDGYNGTPVSDYNAVMGHFKDFFMYLPVMMTTLKETMTGFPKFAEGLRIMTSKTGRLDDDCKCKNNSNEI